MLASSRRASATSAKSFNADSIFCFPFLRFLIRNPKQYQSQWACKVLNPYCPINILTRIAKTTSLILLRQALPPKPCPDSCSPALPGPQYLHWSWSCRFHYCYLYVRLLLYVRERCDTECTDSWTINAVAQDDFSDVPMPDAPAQPPHSPHTGVEKSVSAAALSKKKEERLESRNA